MRNRGCEPDQWLGAANSHVWGHLFANGFGIFFKPPPREEFRSGGGLVSVFVIAAGRAALFLPATRGRPKAGTRWSTRARRPRWRRGATACSTQVERRHRASAARAGFSTARTCLPRSETVPRIAEPDRSATARIARALLFF